MDKIELVAKYVSKIVYYSNSYGVTNETLNEMRDELINENDELFDLVYECVFAVIMKLNKDTDFYE